ncbi:MAG: MarR family transcriptional regulator [Burkholderiales bacterium]|nr:MarR family transcriptional regulator [Burkholderiales bacterium]
MTRRVLPSSRAYAGDSHAADVPATRVLRQFRQIFNAVKTHFKQVEKKVGLGGAQVWALSVVRDAPGIGMGSLANAMNIHQSTASNLVKALVERGLLSVTKHDTDRRAVVLKLLPAGARILKRSPEPFSGVLPEALASLDEKTLKRLEADLKKLIAELHADASAGNILLSEL